MNKLISFTIKAEKGFLKKPDINDGIYLTYNMLHKPAILGIFGAIAGLEGYKENEVLPEYYKQLKHIPVGVRPVNDEKGNFRKTVITYNNTTGFASNEAGGNLIITEQTLINPSYKIYLLLNTEKDIERKLYLNIKEQKAEYLPYLGKNDYSLWWDKEEVEEYEWEKINSINVSYKLSSIFVKEKAVIDLVEDETENLDIFDFSILPEGDQFVSFERLPFDFDESLFQYDYKDFAYTMFKLKAGILFPNTYKLDNAEFIQLN